MRKKETLFKEQVRRDLEGIPNIFLEKIQQVTIRGTPDFLMCLKGAFFGIELKIDGEDPDKLQVYKLSKIKLAGGISLVVTPSSWSRALESIKHFADGGNFIYP